MPHVSWALVNGRPAVEATLFQTAGGQQVTRSLLADTGAGSARARFHLILDENDCLLCGRVLSWALRLGGAYTGSFPVYLLRVYIPQLGFDHYLRAVGVPSVPAGFDGVACFRFLNRFTYGNFGDPGRFGIEI
jgi:hypothetical protein